MSTHVAGIDADYNRAIREPLRAVEDVVHAQLHSSVKMVVDVSNHLFAAGGKRLRPSLVLLSAQACNPASGRARLIDVAASAELIHMATLMHDDVIDKADSRRGRSTANSRWGNHVSVLSGDYILARAFSLLSKNGDMKIMQVLSRATSAMVEGEIRQMEANGNTQELIAAYETIIRNKTAEFVSACCTIGAVVAEASKEYERALELFGENCGMAFQVTDDLLDLTGDPAKTGKPIGGDIREGKITMPVILTLQRASAEDAARIEEIIHGNAASAEEIKWIRRMAEETGALDGACTVAERYVEEAVHNLHLLPESESRTCLEELARGIVGRRS
ncbi:MAG: polyprenyl synthetase family protein [Armatimonadota bacterium]|jgi:octaprenyl-diphosphate synthase|nr:octaprenyl-diphosphate synthase [Armatimonadota bacterium]